VAADSPPADRAAANLRAGLRLLAALQQAGVGHGVLCPGSRSAPLAVAAGLLQQRGWRLHTALDERSAAFFALGLAKSSGQPAAVITTSGSAVAQLLPACVEADHGAIPLLLLTADRPARLKGCGANQSVNQEHFLRCSCRWLGQGDADGIGGMAPAAIEALAAAAYQRAIGGHGALPAGPVHLNLPFEEPLHIGAAALADLAGEGVDSAPGCSPSATATSPARPFGVSLTASPAGASAPTGPTDPAGAVASPLAFVASSAGPAGSAAAASPLPLLDPQQPGVVVAGPWRGCPQAWDDHLEALILWQRRTGWPVLADPLSGLQGQGRLTWVGGYDLLLESPDPALVPAQVLRLGSLPASRRLERWLAALAADQVLVSEGDPRPLDPLAVVRAQTEVGLAAWVRAHPPIDPEEPCLASLRLGGAWWEAERRLQALLDRELGGPMPLEGQAVIAREVSAARAWSEPSLARQLNRLLPAGLPLMLANSSPVRDWESFADPCAAGRPVYGFRGASGIDGTLSEACGLAEALGACLLVSGDLALLHDANGWLWRPQLRGRLTVLLIDNGGGGIFEQLPIRTPRSDLLDFERLFAMPQPLDPLALAQAHGVPCRRLDTPASLGADLAWALEHPFSLLVARTDRRRDAALRQRLRTMAATDASP